jgi:c-di-GMP-binding flagellar brake protein YcgR
VSLTFYSFSRERVLKKMPELIRSIAARFREYLGNRRRAPRYRVRLSVRVSPVKAARPARVSSPEQDALYGYTRDISATGLALILPSIRINNIYLTGEDRTLELLIEHESEPIVIYGISARYEKLEEGEADKGYLVGVRITEMSTPDRTRFTALLK